MVAVALDHPIPFESAGRSEPYPHSRAESPPGHHTTFDSCRYGNGIRKQEYATLDGKKRKFIKGQKYALLSHKENLEGNARKNLKILLAANKRLNTAYVLKESFGQLWDYNRQAWARKFFENWRDQLKWQRLKPYEKFAAMIDAHWDGIAAYCEPENKVPLGFVEGLNNKIRVFQRRAYGLRDEEYLRLKVLSCMLPEI